MDPLLEVSNLHVSFRTYLGTVEAVRGVSFSISPGETVALVGESGCGKSVTAHALMGLISKPVGKVEKGQILFQGEQLLEKSRQEMEQVRGKEIAMIFQDPMTSLNPTMRIGRQIFEGIQKHEKISTGEAQGRALEILYLVGITEPERRLRQYPHELSGGMRQRVIIAIALACNPKLLIADEPTTALDVTIQAQILELMKEIQHKIQTSILLITHDLGIVAGTCDRVLVMYGGRIVEAGPVEKIFASPFHPYTQGLLASVPRLNSDRGEKLVPIYGTPPNLLSPPLGCPFAARCAQAMQICAQKPPTEEALSAGHSASCWLKEAACRS